MSAWAIQTLRVSGGFLPDFFMTFPTGLTCIIGPRGSGKSTLAEALRLVLEGMPVGISKSRTELIRVNLGASILTLTTAPGRDRGGFTVRRSYAQTAVVTGPDSRPLTSVEIDRGTFLPIDAYSSLDIEAIADESLGSKRRGLLDGLCANEMQQIRNRIAEHRRSLDANGDAIRTVQRTLADVSERLEELGDATLRLAAIPAAEAQEGSPEFQLASRQKHQNQNESLNVTSNVEQVSGFPRALSALASQARRAGPSLDASGSLNNELLRAAHDAVDAFWVSVADLVARVERSAKSTIQTLTSVQAGLSEAHKLQDAHYMTLLQQNQQAVKLVEARASAQKEAALENALTVQRHDALADLSRLLEERKHLKSAFLLARDEVSALRERVASNMNTQAGAKVRIRVQRNADTLEYQERLLSAVRGSKLRNHDEIIDVLSSIRPENLAAMLAEDDFAEFEVHTGALGKDRSRKSFDALRQSVDPLELDVLPVEDRVIIELDVATTGPANFKDASELSRGQKCTALLPILMARREAPLLIDQPEDNLDNHFIYETVVESIRRLKDRRQMIFITHNANIPVLGEAELVVVLNSDGKRGFVEKAGTVDQCRTEIIDLLEGGEEAFERRRARYGRRG